MSELKTYSKWDVEYISDRGGSEAILSLEVVVDDDDPLHPTDYVWSEYYCLNIIGFTYAGEATEAEYLEFCNE